MWTECGSRGYKTIPHFKSRSPHSCLAAGRLVRTEEGERPIEEIEAGDRVWGFNEQTGRVELAEVVRTFVRVSETELVVDLGGELIHTTPEHPFWVEGRGWVPAGGLRDEDPLTCFAWPLGLAHGFEAVDATTRTPRPGGTIVHNLEVEGAHNYFVSRRHVLVHNSCAAGGRPSLSEVKDAVKKAHKFVGGPLGNEGYVGNYSSSFTRGNPTRGYRIDPPHPSHAGGPGGRWHVNAWDWSGGKKGTGGRWISIPIGGTGN